MIKVWADDQPAGVLDRYRERGSTFVYDRGIAPERAISLTIPVRTASWNVPVALAPIFEMNLPEGALRERLRLAFAKATGSFDELDLLGIVGRSQLGRLRYTGMDGVLNEEVPFQSVDELLSSRRGGELYRYLIERFAAFSGISGVQPKFLIRDEERFESAETRSRELSQTFRGATHIVKFWNPEEFPQLAANEFFCLQAAEACGLPVSPYRLAEDGSSLVMSRFDLRPDGRYKGFEDFCVLNAKRTDQKYSGSYETGVLKRFQQFARSDVTARESLQLFTLIVLNCAIRNGDAHLKNFGVLYDDVQKEAHLAPAYDLVTTTAYLPKDRMALTLNGTTEWPSGKELMRFAESRGLGSPRELRAIFERVADALNQTRPAIETHSKENPEFKNLSERMLQGWESGQKSARLLL
ncbi:MAG: type II toxin-antitoxin system HipA family toxin [Janthinobacterium lividum]